MKAFWQNLVEKKRPFAVLAPMEDVTDTVFRQIIMYCGRPDVFFTEFTNVEGILSKGENLVAQRLKFLPAEKPVIAQIWGQNPENFKKVASKIAAMGFDGIDINMGCPERSVIKHGACGALIKNKSLAREIILATVEGAEELSVSVKTRLGFNQIATEEWIGFLLEQNLDALTIHGRTVKEMSAVPAHWQEIGEAVHLRSTMKKNTVIIGNGDITNLTDAAKVAANYGVDGVMIGRGVFANPWVFNVSVNGSKTLPAQKLDLLCKHVALFEKTWGKEKNFEVMKKYFKIYVNGFSGASQLRVQLMTLHEPFEVLNLVRKWDDLLCNP